MSDLLTRWDHVMDRVRARGLEEEFCPPGHAADLQEIQKAEDALGRKFPELLRELLVRSDAWSWADADYDVRFLAPDMIVDDTKKPEEEMRQIVVSKSLDGRAKTLFYSPKRLTFAYSDYFRFQIDDDPAPSGRVGQIVVVDHDEETIGVVANSLEEFVSHGLDCIEVSLSQADD